MRPTLIIYLPQRNAQRDWLGLQVQGRSFEKYTNDSCVDLILVVGKYFGKRWCRRLLEAMKVEGVL